MYAGDSTFRTCPLSQEPRAAPNSRSGFAICSPRDEQCRVVKPNTLDKVAMAEKPEHLPQYGPQRTKELVERMAMLRLRWQISVNSRLPNKAAKAAQRPSSRLAKIKQWAKSYRDN
jgi:hypothetical protein